MSSPSFHYEIDSFIAAGSFGKVYSAVVRSNSSDLLGPRPRGLVIDDRVVLKSALLSRIHRVKDLRGGTHTVSLDNKFSGHISGDAFEPRELQMSSLLGKRLSVKALLNQEARRLRKRTRSSEGSLENGSSENDETSSQILIVDETLIESEEVETPLFPTLFDAFFVFDPSLGDRPKEGGSINVVLVNEVKGSDLWTLINSEPSSFAQDSFRRELLRQAFEMLSRLHKKKLIHRDIKLPNLLLDMSPSGFPLLRLGDCGSTRDIPEDEVSEGTPYVCSRFYRAPELLCGSSVYGKGVDIWSIGCTLVELYTQLASNTDTRACAALSLLRGDGSSNPQHKQSASKRRCALFHGAKNDGAQICHILNLLGPPTDVDLAAMKIPAWAEEWMRAQRWFIETSAAIEESGSTTLMQLFIQEVSNFEALIDPAADLSSAVGESASIPEHPPQLSTSLLKALANLKPVHVGSLDMKSILFEHCSMPRDVADLLARCFLWNPEERISCKEALLHPALLHAQPFMPSQAETSRLEGKQRCSDAVEALKAYLKEKSAIDESSKKVALVTTAAAAISSSSSSSAMDETSFSSISGISSATSSTGIGIINLQLSQ